VDDQDSLQGFKEDEEDRDGGITAEEEEMRRK